MQKLKAEDNEIVFDFKSSLYLAYFKSQFDYWKKHNISKVVFPTEVKYVII